MNQFLYALRHKKLSYIWAQFISLFHLDSTTLSFIHRIGAYRYLSRYRYVAARTFQPPKDGETNPYPNKIWVCWLQGVGNAPYIVKRCVESIKAHAGDQEVILITSQNLNEYIRLPEYVIRKWRDKIISNTHFSDMIRIHLLNEYGGIWIDSTVLLTGSIPKYIKKAELFFFQGPEIGKVVASNWFIAAKPHNEIIFLVKELLDEYWKKENSLCSYSIFHLFLTMAIRSTPEREAMWQQVTYSYAELSQMLQNELFNPYRPEVLERITEWTTVHKLSYKPPRENFEKEGTLYRHLFGDA